MTNERPKEKRRVGFRSAPNPSPDDSADTPGASFMILRDADAERIVEGTRSSDYGASSHQNETNQQDQDNPHNSKFRKITARELGAMADKSLQRASVLGERAYSRAATRVAGFTAPAKRVGRLPSLATLAGFGGKRAPGESSDDGKNQNEPRPSAALRPGRRKVDMGSRIVSINDESKNSHFLSNYISTTKYKLWNAIPLFLYEQFGRFSNAYFLIVGIGYCIDAVTPIFTVGRYSTLWVLALVVAISGVKEALEDTHRYREDRRVNRAITHIVGSNEPQDLWASVKVGDIIKVHEKEHLPADIILVGCSNDDGIAYIETKQLDGESNLKVKVVPNAITPAFSTESAALLTKGRIECESPNDRLYKFNGRMIIESAPGSSTSIDASDPDEITESVPLNEPIALGPENIMIRGSSVRNTAWVLGIVVNTGRDTKLMQNVKPKPRKNSRLERETNRHYFISLFLQIAIVVALTVRSSQVCGSLFDRNRINAWYLIGNQGSDEFGCEPIDSFLKLFTFFLTFAALIPISLYVSMELVRAFQVYFIENDQTIADPETGVRTEVRTSNLNEELGVIHHVFTDKTGTLTANRMEFKKCSISGKVYELAESPNPGATSMQDLKEALQAGPESSAVRKFSTKELEDADIALRLLSLCHSVVAENNDDDDISENNTDDIGDGSSAASSAIRKRRLRLRRQRGEPESSDGIRSSVGRGRQESSLNSMSNRRIGSRDGNHRLASSLNGSTLAQGPANYQASSPDEAALVQAARAQGFTYVSRSNRDTVIGVFGKLETHELLETIEFDSTRKRMSVITRDPEGQVRIYTKGADAIIFERLAPGQSSETTERHLHDFAVEGLRTLCLAYADLDDDWFVDWHKRYRLACSEMNNREEAVAAVADEVERNLTLLGATAIEDKLQDGVPATLKKLEQAGVKIWVLTGDKQETAINIGLSCGAIDEGMDVVIINEDNVEDTAAQIDRALGRWSAMLTDKSMKRKLGLVIDGQTLHYALEPQLQKKLMVVTSMARSVIACRVSPKQKTEIVELVRRHDKEKVTLAIGDGANDVGMIQAAHVGVGIVGLEGQEAKLASDYSISQFRFLGRLMLVHGRWSYKRLAKMVLFTIYKNSALVLCEMYWATFSAYTGQPLLDPWLGGLYNIFITSLPPIVLGIFDQELSADYALTFPEVYMKGQRNTAYNFRVFMSWILSALWQSAVIFFVCIWGFGDLPVSNGQNLGMWAFGVVVFSAVTVNVHAMLLVFQSSWTSLTLVMFIISFLSWFMIAPLFSWKPIALTGNLSPPMYAVTHRIFAEPKFWFVCMLCPVICVSPSLLWKYRKRRRRPNLKMLVQDLLRMGKTREQITGEPQVPLKRVPSYDPKRSSTPAGPVTFVVKGEKEYQFSGFNFDAGETGAVLRHTFHTSRGVRRKKMRVLKRAGSDTELDVEGVKTAAPDSPEYVQRMTEEWVSEHARGEAELARTLLPPRAQASTAQHGMNEIDNATFENMQKATHRRAISDGAVLVESRYERLDKQHDEEGYGADESSDEDHSPQS